MRALLRCLSVASVLCLAAPAWAAGTLEVRVSDPDGRALPGVTVGLAGTSNECVTNAEGLCRFEAIAARTYQVTAHLAGFMPARADVQVEEGKAASIPFTLSTQVHFSESVTVSPTGRDTFESYQPATVLGGEELSQNLAPTLGETLGKQVGVNMRAFGPGPSRPVIRGLDGDRVLILENGARTGDLSSQSADHGVNLDPASATQIEVVRGPATLLYGSNALGGVVNIVSDEIPNRPVKGARGNLTLQGGTANDEAGIAGNVTGGNGRWAVRAGGSASRTGDVTTPEGDIPNSQTKMKSGGASAGYTADNGYAGVAYQYVDNRYGIPFVEEGGTTLHPRRHRVDFRAERRGMPGWIEGIKALGGYRNYTHDEIEASGEIATTFKNKFTEGEVLLNHRPAGRLRGTIGGWATHRDYSSLGEESLAPPTTQNAFAGFLYEELTFDKVSLQFGGRVDRTKFSPDGAAVDRPELRDRDFTEFSGSIGLVGRLSNEVSLAVNVARAARNPSLEELYNFGAHVGNFAFEIGNPELPSERGLGVDVSLRYRGRRFQGEATYFRNSIDSYIFAFPTGEFEDDLAVVNFLSADSLLQGFELHTDIGLTNSLWLELGGDGVHAELRDTDQPLPRIPPYRGWVALRYERGGFHLEGEVRGAAKQDRIFGAETPTPGYAVLNGHGSYTFTTGKTAHTVTLRVGNATDKLYRNHLSFIKDIAPEMGRTVKLVYALRF
jgi:iron complex outermembrane receptor protein